MLRLERLNPARLRAIELPPLVEMAPPDRVILGAASRTEIPREILDRAITRYESKLAHSLESLRPASLEGLRPVPGAQKIAGGTKPMFELEDAAERRFLLKAAPEELVEAEILGYQIAQLLSRPAVPAMRCEIDLDTGERIAGVLRPKLPFDPTNQLPSDTRKWSHLQREVMLRGHPLEWLLDNLDGHEGQYALLDGIGYPLNIDWDRSYEHHGKSRLSRHSKHRPWLPNLKNFLYADYVSGRIDLDFTGMLQEAERIRDLPLNKLHKKLVHYAESRDWSEAKRERFIERVIQRKQGIVHEFDAFVARIQSERQARTGFLPGDGWNLVNLMARRAKDRVARVEQKIRVSSFGESLRERKKKQADIGEIDWSQPIHIEGERQAAAPRNALFSSGMPLPFVAAPIGVKDGLLSLDGDLLDTDEDQVVDVVLMPDGKLFGAPRDSSSPPTHAHLAGGGPVAAAAEIRGQRGRLTELREEQADYELSEAHFAQLLAEMSDRNVATDQAVVLTKRRKT